MTRFYYAAKRLDGTPNPLHVKRPYKPIVRHTVKKQRSAVSKFERGSFVAWDGEGITVGNDVHRYVMFINSVGTVLIDSTLHASNGHVKGLSTAACLDALCTVGEAHPKSIHVVFGGSYDVNMILSDCTIDEIRKVWAGEWVTVCKGKYLVNYRARKSFSVKRNGFLMKAGQLTRVKDTQGIVLWDVFGFFQSSFVEALKKYMGNDYEPITLIAKRKAERRDFTIDGIPDIIDYCKLECTALVALMHQLRDYLAQAGLTISRWDGAGACAAALLKREGVIAYKAARDATPRAFLHAAEHAYAGGRTETLKYGHAPTLPIYHYDINSAYPYAMQNCPALSVGQWQKFTGSPRDDGDDFCLCHVEWNFADGAVAYPLFWRSFDTSIYYPRTGRGWYWFPEVRTALLALRQNACKGTLTIKEHWRLSEPVTNRIYPFTWISELFEQRRQWKQQKIGAEKVVKLAINSLYGKTAQHIGGVADKPPRYHQLEWAGYITSVTRATLYTALLPTIRGRNKHGVMLATDAVYSTIPLDLPTGEHLGSWSNEPHDGITIVQSGVYWTYNDGVAKPFCRGFDKGSLSIDTIVDAWRDKRDSCDATLTRFVTMGSALASDDTFRTNWQRWKTAPRTLSITPNGTKRADVARWSKRHDPSSGLIDTQPAIPAAQLAGQFRSAPYPLPWSDAGKIRDVYFDGAKLSVVEQEAYDSFV